MGEVLKFPGVDAKRGYRRARKRRRLLEDPNQLDLFLPPPAPIATFTTALSTFEQALLYDERGDERAIALYLQAIAAEDRVADAFCNLGILESKKGNTARAFDCFTKSLQHDPRHSEAHYNLANLYFEVNDFRLAQVHYEMAAEVDPLFANAFYNLALVQSLNHQYARAIASLARYQQVADADEARKADDLLRELRQALATNKDPRLVTF